MFIRVGCMIKTVGKPFWFFFSGGVGNLVKGAVIRAARKGQEKPIKSIISSVVAMRAA